MDKTCIDPWAHEIDRAIRIEGTNNLYEAEYVSVRIPLRSTDFQTKYFPDYVSREPQMKYEDYASGTNAPVKLTPHS